MQNVIDIEVDLEVRVEVNGRFLLECSSSFTFVYVYFKWISVRMEEHNATRSVCFAPSFLL